MKLQTLALAVALAATGSAFAHTVEKTVTHTTPNGTVTKHIVRTNDRDEMARVHTKRVVVVHPQHRRHVKKVVVVHPSSHGRNVVNRTVVIHHNS